MWSESIGAKLLNVSVNLMGYLSKPVQKNGDYWEVDAKKVHIFNMDFK